MLYSKPQWLKATVIYYHRHAGLGSADLHWAPSCVRSKQGLADLGWRICFRLKSGWVWATCLSSSLDRELAPVCSSYGDGRGTGRQAKTQKAGLQRPLKAGPTTGPLIPLVLAPQLFFIMVPLCSL